MLQTVRDDEWPRQVCKLEAGLDEQVSVMHVVRGGVVGNSTKVSTVPPNTTDIFKKLFFCYKKRKQSKRQHTYGFL